MYISRESIKPPITEVLCLTKFLLPPLVSALFFILLLFYLNFFIGFLNSTTFININAIEQVHQNYTG